MIDKPFSIREEIIPLLSESPDRRKFDILMRLQNVLICEPALIVVAGTTDYITLPY